MADINGIDWNTIGIFAGGFVGTAIGALALRMGWKSGGGSPKDAVLPPDTLELKTAIIDSSSIKVLAGSIEGLGFNLLELKKVSVAGAEASQKVLERLGDSLDAHTEELRQLSREIREHTRELSKSNKG